MKLGKGNLLDAVQKQETKYLRISYELNSEL